MVGQYSKMCQDTDIRCFESKDADALVALWHQELPPSQPWNDPLNVLFRKRKQNDDLIFVAELDGKIVGSVMAGYDGVRGWIYGLFVDAQHRRRHIGRQLLSKVEVSLCQLGCPKVNLQVRATNTEVFAFYQRCGYVMEDRESFGKPLPVDDASLVAVPTIQVSETIKLSPITLEDRPAYLQHLNETDDIHTRTASIPFPYTEFDVDQWLATELSESIGGDARISWAIRNERNEFIGSVGLMHVTEGERAEIGYWLAQPYWNHGIMTSVVRCLCPFAFEQYQLCRIHATVFASNPGSAKVLQKSGFVLEGTLRKHFFMDGVSKDVLMLGLLRGEAV